MKISVQMARVVKLVDSAQGILKWYSMVRRMQVENSDLDPMECLQCLLKKLLEFPWGMVTRVQRIYPV